MKKIYNTDFRLKLYTRFSANQHVAVEANTANNAKPAAFVGESTPSDSVNAKPTD